MVQSEEYGYEVALDVARSAVRLGAGNVHLMCLESAEEMPAYEEEVAESLKEGVLVHNSIGPKRIVTENGKCVGVETLRCSSVFDQNGRFAPTFVAGSESVLACDTVLLAIGQEPDLELLGERNKLDLTPHGFVKADPKTMATSLSGVYVGGDVAFGARTAIEAVADGRRAARSIHRYLSGEDADPTSVGKPRLVPLPLHQMPSGYDRIARLEVPTIPVGRRTGVTEVEEGFTRDQAMLEASRCLKCNRYPMVDEKKCVLCGGCVDICPFGCLRIVPVDQLQPDAKIDQLATTRHGLSLEVMSTKVDESGNRWYAMLKDDEKCTRCGLCVERCPVGAIWMGSYQEEGYATG